MFVSLTSDEIRETVLKLMAGSGTPDELAARLMGFASAHFAYRGTPLHEWLACCEKSYVESRGEGIRRGLIDAPD